MLVVGIQWRPSQPRRLRRGVKCRSRLRWSIRLFHIWLPMTELYLLKVTVELQEVLLCTQGNVRLRICTMTRNYLYLSSPCPLVVESTILFFYLFPRFCTPFHNLNTKGYKRSIIPTSGYCQEGSCKIVKILACFSRHFVQPPSTPFMEFPTLHVI